MNSVAISDKRNHLRSIAVMLLAAAIAFTLSACGTSRTQVPPQNADQVAEDDHGTAPAEPGPAGSVSSDEIVGADTPDSEEAGDSNELRTEGTTVPELKMKINGNELPVIWENNDSVDALKELASASPITVEMSMYGGFEQVGALGANIPRNDVQIMTQAGDIVLYSGNQIVVFYGSNSWAYTRLGKIDGMSSTELRELLGSEAVELIICAE